MSRRFSCVPPAVGPPAHSFPPRVGLKCTERAMSALGQLGGGRTSLLDSGAYSHHPARAPNKPAALGAKGDRAMELLVLRYAAMLLLLVALIALTFLVMRMTQR